MDRQTVYPGQILPETTLLQIAKDSMIGLAKLSAAMLGTGTIANGFAVTPTGPASLQVVCAPGEIYSMTSVDATAFSSLPADTTHSILKQGILLDGVTLNCPAPGTTGQSINYLVQVTYQDADSSPVLLPYYNSANPALPFSGMGNNGLTQNTVRKGSAVVVAKAGASAVTGSQTTPSPDVGYIGLYVVTVAYGQTTITSASIGQYALAPLMPSGLIQSVQSGNSSSALDTGTANAYVCAFTPAITARSEQLVLRFKVKNTNTGASTFNDGLGAVALVGAAHAALQGGELLANGDAWVQWNSSIGSGAYILLFCTGAPEQVAPAIQSQHAIQLAQMTGLVGGVRNGSMAIAAPSGSATFTADEIAVKTAFGGQSWLVKNFSQAINLGANGAGGMDNGLSPISGFLAIYAIYNPTTGASALLGTDATSALQSSIYGGSFMPSGYTASALISVWPTNSSRALTAGYQKDRDIYLAPTQVLSTTTMQPTLTALSISSAVPKNARGCDGTASITSASTPANLSFGICGSSVSLGLRSFTITNSAVNGGLASQFTDVPLVLPQTVYYLCSTSSGITTLTLTVTRYSI